MAPIKKPYSARAKWKEIIQRLMMTPPAVEYTLNKGEGRYGPLIGTIYHDMNATFFMIYSARTSQLVTSYRMRMEVIKPRENWMEMDPLQIMKAVYACIDTAVIQLKLLRGDPYDVQTIGVTNQRDTFVVWDKTTGQPLYNAIVALDSRAEELAQEMSARMPSYGQDYLRPLCGLPVCSYFSAIKLHWLFLNVPTVLEAVKERTCLFGTIDTWIIWNLTGGASGGKHVTDVTNASRTMLMNLHTLDYDPVLLRYFEIPRYILPEIRSSSEVYGYVARGLTLTGVPISGCLGDEQASLVGNLCLTAGMAKNSYGESCYLLLNTGTKLVHSHNGFLSTVAFKLGKKVPAYYALEASVPMAGECMKWLNENMGIGKDPKDIQRWASEVADTTGVYFVPAFDGLLSPYWHKEARGTLCGLTQSTEKAHVSLAVLESIGFQTRDVMTALHRDAKIPIHTFVGEGILSKNNQLMQIQANLLGMDLVRPRISSSAGLGAAITAGLAEGVKVWQCDTETFSAIPTDVFTPSMGEKERNQRYDMWKAAVNRCYEWANAVVPQ